MFARLRLLEGYGEQRKLSHVGFFFVESKLIGDVKPDCDISENGLGWYDSDVNDGTGSGWENDDEDVDEHMDEIHRIDKAAEGFAQTFPKENTPVSKLPRAYATKAAKLLKATGLLGQFRSYDTTEQKMQPELQVNAAQVAQKVSWRRAMWKGQLVNLVTIIQILLQDAISHHCVFRRLLFPFHLNSIQPDNDKCMLLIQELSRSTRRYRYDLDTLRDSLVLTPLHKFGGSAMTLKGRVCADKTYLETVLRDAVEDFVGVLEASMAGLFTGGGYIAAVTRDFLAELLSETGGDSVYGRRLRFGGKFKFIAIEKERKTDD
ncbi:MAG: hypothetical protein M1840_006724 [Geoglossum simile]|nr:MAG: hypothetical protein M1840_006724 [Geoglossum simile]